MPWGLFGTSARQVHASPLADSKATSAEKVSREWIIDQIDRLEESVSQHRVLSHPFFKLLEELSRPGNGYTPAQIDLITANYFRACLEVIPAIVNGIELAIRRGDAFALAKLAENLNEEAGEGRPEEGHRALALVSLNAIRKLHDCSALTVDGTYDSPRLLPAVTEFIEALEQLNLSFSAHEALAVEYADERVSLPMMSLYFRTLVEPFKAHFRPEEWSKITKYWELHTGGLEARHAADLLASLKEACRTPDDVEKARSGAAAFLALQCKMLDAVDRAARQAGKVGKVVPIPVEPMPARTAK